MPRAYVCVRTRVGVVEFRCRLWERGFGVYFIFYFILFFILYEGHICVCVHSLV
jgi:hypothetical protein